jgi:hypothetical protein
LSTVGDPTLKVRGHLVFIMYNNLILVELVVYGFLLVVAYTTSVVV